MILVTFVRHNLIEDKKQMDFIQRESLDDVWTWLHRQGGRMTFSLNKKKRCFTQRGWEKVSAPTPNQLQVMNDELQMLTTVYRIVSDEGILFEDVVHCSEKIVDLVASKYVLKPTD